MPLLRNPFNGQLKPSPFETQALAISIIERNRLLNRDAIEAIERTQRFIDSIGGFEALERIRQQAELERYARQAIADERLRSWIESQGPLFCDLMDLLDSEDDLPQQRWRKVSRFVFYFGAKLSDWRADRALREMSRELSTGMRTLLERVYFPAALMDVLARKDIPQTVRLSTKWVTKTASGRLKPRRPSDLFWYQFFLWIRKEVYNETEKKLLDKVTQQDATEKLVHGGFYEREETWHSPEKPSIADEQIFRNYWRENFFGSSEKDLHVLKASEKISLKSLLCSNTRLTPREKEILKILVRNGLNTPAQLIAKKMQIAESTARVFKRNLLQKFPFFSAL